MTRAIKVVATNKNARIETRIDRTGKVRTETVRRDLGQMDVAISTDRRNNSTRCFIDINGRNTPGEQDYVELSGREARTLYTLLQKHFDALETTYS